MTPLNSPPDDVLAFEALRQLERARSEIDRRVGRALHANAISKTGFNALVLLSISQSGELGLQDLRKRLRTSKANATEVF